MRSLGIAVSVVVVALALLAAWTLHDSGSSAANAAAAVQPSGGRVGGDGPATSASPGDVEIAATPDAESSARELTDSEDPAAPAKKPANASRVIGRVVSDKHEPVAGATVLATTDVRASTSPLDSPRWEGDKHRRKVVTDSDGKFALENVPPGALRVAVRAKTFAPLDLEPRNIAAQPVTDLGDLALELGVALGGMVVDARGTPVPNAALIRPYDDSAIDNAQSALDVGPIAATSAADGTFLIDVQAAGPWTIVVHSDEHPDLVARGSLEMPGARKTDLLLRLPEASGIDGVVITRGGVGDPEVAHLLVTARNMNGGRSDPFAAPLWQRETKCGADGRFHIGGLLEGDPYALNVLSPDLDDPNRRDSVKTVTATGGDRDVEIRLAPAIVFDAHLSDASSGRAIDDADTRLSSNVPNRGSRDLATDDQALGSGKLRITSNESVAETATLALQIGLQGYKTQRLEGLGAQPGRVVDLGDVKLQPLPGVRVHVTDSVTGASLVDARVTVELTQGSDGTSDEDPRRNNERRRPRIRSTHSGADGICTLYASPNARGLGCATHDEHAPSELFDVDFAGVNAPPIEIVLSRGGRAEVTVLDAGGAPLAGAQVRSRTVVSDNPPPGANLRVSAVDRTSDGDGLAVLEPLIAGRYRFWLDEPRMGAPKSNTDPRGSRAEDEVRDGLTTSITLRAAPRSRLHGVVREAGVPLVGAQLALAPGGSGNGRDPSSWDRALHTRTDSSGRYVFDGLGPGTWTLAVTHATRMTPVTDTFEIESGDVERDIVLPQATILGRVHDSDGRPIGGARVTLVMWSDDNNGRAVDFPGWTTLFADEGGEFRMHGVPPGRKLAVRGRAPGFQTSYSAPVQLGNDETRAGVDVALKPGARIEVVVTGGTLTPRARAIVVRLDKRGRPIDSEQRQSICNADSVAVFDSLTPGKWRVTGSQQRDDQNHRASRDVDAKSGETSRVEVAID